MRSNGVHLMGCYAIAALKWTAAEVVATFASVYPPLLPFRDASYGPSTYPLQHEEIWRGFARGVAADSPDSAMLLPFPAASPQMSLPFPAVSPEMSLPFPAASPQKSFPFPAASPKVSLP